MNKRSHAALRASQHMLEECAPDYSPPDGPRDRIWETTRKLRMGGVFEQIPGAGRKMRPKLAKF